MIPSQRQKNIIIFDANLTLSQTLSLSRYLVCIAQSHSRTDSFRMLMIGRFKCGSETHRMGYHSKAVSGTRTMAVSLGRSDVPGAQVCDLVVSPGSRDFRGRFLPQNQRKIEFGLIRWAGPSLRVFTAIFLASYPQKESLARKKRA